MKWVLEALERAGINKNKDSRKFSNELFFCLSCDNIYEKSSSHTEIYFGKHLSTYKLKRVKCKTCTERKI